MPGILLMGNYSTLPVNVTPFVNRSEVIIEDEAEYGYFSEESSDAIEHSIYMYIGPIFIIFGILGNTLAFITLCRPPLSNFSSSVYLAAFCFAAVLILSFSLGVDWYYNVFEHTHFKHSSESICRLWGFFDIMVKCAGVWFIVGAVTDRFIGLWFPYKAQDMCTVFIAKVSVSVSLIAVTALNVHAMWMHNYDIPHSQCYIDSRSEFKFIWYWASTLLCNLIPQSLIFIIGNLLVLRMCLKHRGRQIPETASIEMDLTFTVMIFAIVYATFSLPSSITTIVISLNRMLMQDAAFVSFVYYINYLNWISYSCMCVILSVRSAAFRESVKGMAVGCVNIIKHGTSTVEMKMITEDYEQVPSTSTTL